MDFSTSQESKKSPQIQLPGDETFQGERSCLLVELDGRDPRTYAIIGAAMQVHRDLGPGFLESVYQNCLALRLKESQVPYEREKPLEVEYLGKTVGTFRADFLCFADIVVELKAQTSLGRSEVAQLANYLAVTKKPLGLLLNFGGTSLQFQRVIGRHAKKSRSEELPEKLGASTPAD